MTDRLSPRMRQIVELVAGRGLSYAEVAKELGISQSAVNRYAEQIGARLRKAPRKAMFSYYRDVIQTTTQEVA